MLRIGLVTTEARNRLLQGMVKALQPYCEVVVLPADSAVIEAYFQVAPLHLLHAFGAGEVGSLACVAGRYFGIPSVVSIVRDELAYLPDIGYGLQTDDTARQQVEITLLSADYVIAPSPKVAWQTSLLFPHTATHRIKTVPFAVDTNHFVLPHEHQRRTRDYLFIGDLSPEKDPITALNLLATFPNSTLDIVGDGVMRNRLETLARRVGIEDRVRFHGVVSYDDLPRFYQQAQFLIVTSRYEVFGVEAIEALACGLGVIGTDVGIMSEIGAVVPEGDIVEFQKMILSRTRHQTWEQRLRYRMLAEYDYSLPRLSERLLAVYAELLPDVRVD